LAGLVTVALVLGLANWGLESSRDIEQVVTRLVVPLEPGVLEGTTDRGLAYSPDGSRIVYAYDGRLRVRSLDRLSSTPLLGTEGAADPFFSPDSRWIGFWQSGQLKRVSREGGSPVVLAETRMPWGVDWAADDTLLLGQGREGIARVPAAGGVSEIIIRDPGRLARAPQLLPGGRAVLFTSGPVSFDWSDAQIVVHELENGERTVLIGGASNARYVLSGHLVYVARGTLMAAPFDPDALELTGDPVSLDENVAETLGGNTPGEAYFGISNAGFLAYFSPLSSALSARTLAWVDRLGNEEPINAEPRAYIYARLSPDGKRAAFDIRDQGNDVWTWEFATERLTRVTTSAGNVRERAPAWSPDGQWLVFDSNRDDGPPNIFLHDVVGAGAEERLTTSPNNQFAATFTPDGRHLLFQESVNQQIDIMQLELDNRRVTPLLQTSFVEVNPRVAPNGRWLAYESDESGRPEVYVRPFPEVERGVRMISTGGGTRPVWAHSGKELFYVSLRGELMSVTFEPESGAPGRSSVLLGASHAWAADFSPPAFDVSPDDARFLVIKRNAVGEQSAAPGSLIVVSNWFEELRRRAPPAPE
jgi:serine/threonine-protein kinase